MTSWPVTLPKPLTDTVKEGMADNVLRSSMDVGPGKTRLRTQANIRPLAFSMLLTDTQAATLTTFFNTTTSFGSLPFTFTDPRTAATLNCRFTDPPQLSVAGGKYWNAAISLEILP